MKVLTKISKMPKDWKVIDKPIPTYDDDQVLIRVEYIGICGSDVHTYEGHCNVKAENLTIGHEFAGVVAEVGKNVTSETTFKICGKCRYCKEGQYNLCSTRKGLGSNRMEHRLSTWLPVRKVATSSPKTFPLAMRR